VVFQGFDPTCPVALLRRKGVVLGKL
jgi:hypothetical protein